LAKFFVGLDLGQANDYTALSVLERQQPAGGTEVSYHVRHLERVRNAPYPRIVEKVTAMLQAPPLAGESVLVVDETGVGAPITDLFREAQLPLVAVHIHGGDAVSAGCDTFRVPKRHLVATLQVLFQSGLLKISKKLSLASVLQAELLNFKVKIDPKTAHDSYSAWREEDHDDLVLSVALSAWRAEQEPASFPPLVFGGGNKKCGWRESPARYVGRSLISPGLGYR
jgi:hypothetical protein